MVLARHNLSLMAEIMLVIHHFGNQWFNQWMNHRISVRSMRVGGDIGHFLYIKRTSDQFTMYGDKKQLTKFSACCKGTIMHTMLARKILNILGIHKTSPG
ncbi:hypothetical protein AM228_02105 [Planktothricoides sp. SR001]|nr:hypothetical protein AM228_02105 [Planktothricoides sp. SR001]